MVIVVRKGSYLPNMYCNRTEETYFVFNYFINLYFTRTPERNKDIDRLSKDVIMLARSTQLSRSHASWAASTAFISFITYFSL